MLDGMVVVFVVKGVGSGGSLSKHTNVNNYVDECGGTFISLTGNTLDNYNPNQYILVNHTCEASEWMLSDVIFFRTFQCLL